MLVLSLVLGLVTCRIDYAASFLHIPILSIRKSNTSLGYLMIYPKASLGQAHKFQTPKSLHEMRRASRNFFHYLKSKLYTLGWNGRTLHCICSSLIEFNVTMLLVFFPSHTGGRNWWCTEEQAAWQISQPSGKTITWHVSCRVDVKLDNANLTMRNSQSGITHHTAYPIDALMGCKSRYSHRTRECSMLPLTVTMNRILRNKLSIVIVPGIQVLEEAD